MEPETDILTMLDGLVAAPLDQREVASVDATLNRRLADFRAAVEITEAMQTLLRAKRKPAKAPETDDRGAIGLVVVEMEKCVKSERMGLGDWAATKADIVGWLAKLELPAPKI